jgi:uncharacterized damage-inducible protein DinB
MEFSLEKSIPVLERTPAVLESLLKGLDQDWTHQNEGGDTWSPFDVLGHLVHGEMTDWPARINIILKPGGDKTFATFDRFAQFHESKGKTLQDLLAEFRRLRKANIEMLRGKNITEDMLRLTGIHPAFGTVTLQQLLSTWTAHDLQHIGQIVRVMARQYKENVGPWVQYMRVLQD